MKPTALLFLLIFFFSAWEIRAQGSGVITTAVPFLLIGPDARGTGMASTGAATAPDAYSLYWNAAKMPFSSDKTTFGVSYVPWLPETGIGFYSGAFSWKPDQLSGVGTAIRYFSLGTIEFTDDKGNFIKFVNPFDVAVDAGYSRKLADHFSVGIAGHGIYSAPNGFGDPITAATFAGDLTCYYQSDSSDIIFSAGAGLYNMGGKLRYGNSCAESDLPTSVKMGACATFRPDRINNISVALDLNKVIAPYPQVPTFLAGFNSQTQFEGITPSACVEYWFKRIIGVRTGYFYENISAGGRQYFSAGISGRFSHVSIDVALLKSQGLIDNTMAFTVSGYF